MKCFPKFLGHLTFIGYSAVYSIHLSLPFNKMCDKKSYK